MKKLLALALALMLALSCCGAFAEAVRIDPKETEPAVELPEIGQAMATINGSVTVDAETVKALISMSGALDESALPVLDTVLALVNNAGAKLTIAENGGQFDLLLKDQAVLSLGLAVGSEVVLVSDLIPNYAVVVDQETLHTFLETLEQYTGQINNFNIDVDAVAEAILPHVEAMITAVAEKIGQPEAGSYTFEGAPFNMKVPVNITTKEFALLLLNGVKDIMSEEVVANAISEISAVTGQEMNLDLSGLDQAIADIEGQADEELPVTEIAVYYYVDENGNTVNTYFDASMTKDDEAVSVQFGQVDGVVYGHLNALEQAKVDLVATANETGVNVGIDFNMQGMYVGLAISGSMTETGAQGTVAVYFMNPQAPVVTLNAELVFGGEITLAVDGANKTVVTVAQLMADEDGSVLGGLLTDLQMYGLSNLLGKAAAAMPDEVTALMGLLSGGEQ